MHRFVGTGGTVGCCCSVSCDVFNGTKKSRFWAFAFLFCTSSTLLCKSRFSGWMTHPTSSCFMLLSFLIATIVTGCDGGVVTICFMQVFYLQQWVCHCRFLSCLHILFLWREMSEVDELVKANYEVVWMKKGILLWFVALFTSGVFVLHSISVAPLFVVIAVPGFFITIFVGSIIGGYIFFREHKRFSRARALKEAFITLFY